MKMWDADMLHDEVIDDMIDEMIRERDERRRMSTMPTACPHCSADLQGEPIPVERIEEYGGATHYSLAIGCYDRDEDRVTQWQCGECGGRWDRSDDEIGMLVAKDVNPFSQVGEVVKLERK